MTLPEIYLKEIKIENFMSFKKGVISFIKENSEIAHFTIITGPNGAGKSSVFQSLKYVLGSNSKDGRYKKWDDFIRYGSDVMRVSAVFVSSTGKMINIERINRKNHGSIFKLNGKPVQAEKVRNFARKFKLKPDNPFLFIRQGDVNGIKDLSNEQIFHLIESGVGIQEIRTEIEKNNEKLSEIKDKITQLYNQKDVYQKNEKILKEKLLILNEKRALEKKLIKANAERTWAKKENLIKRITSIKEKIKEKEKNVNHKDKLIEEIDARILDLQNKIKTIDNDINECNRKLATNKSQISELNKKKNNWSDEKKRLFDLNKEIKKKKETIKGNIEYLETQKNQLIAKNKHALFEIKTLEQINEQLQKQMDDIRSEYSKNKEWIDLYESIQKRIKNTEIEVESLQSDIHGIIMKIKDYTEQENYIKDYLRENKWYFSNDIKITPREYYEKQFKDISLRISSLSNELDASRMKETELRKKLFSSKKGNGKGRIPKETMLLAQDIKSSGMDERIKGPIFEFLKFDQEHARAIDAVFKKNNLLGFVAFNKNDFTYLNS
ncbi:MAG: AAA family ATPase, partial [Promethearchaeota archaeon]